VALVYGPVFANYWERPVESCYCGGGGWVRV